MTIDRAKISKSVALAIALGSAVMASACASIPQRAWDNGRAMQSTWQYRELQRGVANPALIKGMYDQSNALSLGRPGSGLRYYRFGRW